MRTNFFLISFCLLIALAYGGPPAAYAIDAEFKIWETQPWFGNDPNQTIADINGLTAQVNTPTNPLTVVTVYENTWCSGWPCGVTYWNPVTNLHRCYGYSSGVMRGVDLSIWAPTKTSADGKTFGPGDTWLFKSGWFDTGAPYWGCGGTCSLTVQFVGSDNFRSWQAGDLQGGAVDQATGNVWYADTGGFIGLLDPATNSAKRWSIGGRPFYIALDSTGRGYTTVGVSNEIVRIDPVTNEVKRWAVPTPGGLATTDSVLEYGDNPNGIAIDVDGRVWFSETDGNKVGRLDPTTNQLCEYSKTGINKPQNIATSGTSGAGNLQAFFTEGGTPGGWYWDPIIGWYWDPGDDPGAVTVLTQVEAKGTSQESCTTVTPLVSTITPSEVTHAPFDHTNTPNVATISPEIYTVTGEDGVPGSGATKTAGGEPIPGILRFPIPGGRFTPTGMTQVALPNTVFGSLVGSDDHFQVKSGAIIAPSPGECDDDGIPDAEDNCPCTSNPDQADLDGDGVGDVCDNCALYANADQSDFDNDSLGDVCDSCPKDADNDADADTVCGDEDQCPETALPESVPTLKLGVNRFANTDTDAAFETVLPKGTGPQKSFTMADTKGCSCSQIIEILDLGLGHEKFGCSISAMEDFIALLAAEVTHHSHEVETALAIRSLECIR